MAIGSLEEPLGAAGWAGGSNLVQLAPMALQRMRAAGPGKFSARLKIFTPFKGRIGAAGEGAVAMRVPETVSFVFSG
jgi:hypothetical protein